jgi:ATP-dependent DNA helicase RecG
MRPDLLTPLFASITSLKGVGEKTVKPLTALLRPNAPQGQDARLLDLLMHLPRGLVDRRYRCTIVQLPQRGVVTLEVTVGKHKVPPRGRNVPYRVEVFDDTGTMSLVYFKAFPDHMQRLLPPGEKRVISGEVEWYGAEAQMNHPDHVVTMEAAAMLPQLEPVYPLTEGVGARSLHKLVQQALPNLPRLPEWQDMAWLKKNDWPDFYHAMISQHLPPSPAPMAPDSPERTRLAYDELLANQLALTLVRANLKRAKGQSLTGDGRYRDTMEKALPYTLTGAQAFALAEIEADMAAPYRMIRLLQGDVGAGKTAVAMLALARAVEAGTQGALMVPTEILARQHFASFERMAAPHGLRIAVLTGSEKGAAREHLLARLQAGDIDILIGTHALFQDGVEFANLGLAVIDEQHRFGVHQRMALQAKSQHPVDVLVMTATPIPRTLALTVYGDMEVSKITEKPAGRLPIDTRTVPMQRIEEVVAGLTRTLSKSTRAYWVCPLVEESELVDMTAAMDRFTHLKELFPDRVGIVHGRMKGVEKDQVMARFKAGEIQLLVSTTVIEVGVDVPEASIMVIENAERFGLAQLHQLRGRVGRGVAKSSCILLYSEPLSETAKKRLSIMRETEDGFRIAEEDLRLRGAGEMLGTAQSGIPLFKVADLAIHGELLAAARDDAQLVLAKDPKLLSPRGEALRHLLYLFERDAAIKLLNSG